MKRFICIILTACFLLQLTAVATDDIISDIDTDMEIINENILSQEDMLSDDECRPDGVVYEKKNIIDTNFTDNVPEAMKGSKIISDAGNKVYRIDGKNNMINDTAVAKVSGDMYFETDFKLVKSSGSTTGAFTVSQIANGSSVRFAYVSAIKYNSDTGMGDGSEVIKDRIAIVWGGGTNAGKWSYLAISDEPLGVQNSSMTTPWLKMKGVCIGDDAYMSIYDADGNLLDSLSVVDNDMIKEGRGGLAKSGNFQFTSHSCEVMFDDIVCSEVGIFKKPELKFETKNCEVGKTVNYGFFDNGEAVDAESLKINSLDNEASLNQDTKNVIYKSPGVKKLEATIFDFYSKKTLKYTAEVEAKDKLVYKNIDIVPEKERVYKGEKIGFKVIATDENNDKFDITGEQYEVTCKGNYDNKKSTVVFNNSGSYTISAKYLDLNAQKDIYVSKYTSLSPKIGNDTVENGDILSYSMDCVENGRLRHLKSSEYKLTADKEGLVIEDGTINAIKTGVYKLTFSADNMEEYIELTVNEKKKGILISEDFEGSSPMSEEFFGWDSSDIVSDNGNRVLMLEDEETKMYGSINLKRYTVSAKVKIADPVLDERCGYSTFEMTMNRREFTTPGFEAESGKGGINNIYRINHNIDGGSHMRIGPAVGPKLNIEDGKYHNFKIDVYGNQVIFSIDGHKQYYNIATHESGYFTFMANNCRVYIDDFKLEKLEAASIKDKKVSSISAEENTVYVNPFEPWQFRAINAFRANYSDGTFSYLRDNGSNYSYLADDENQLEFEQVDGFENGDVLRKTTIVFDKNVKDGATITVKAKYMGKSTTFKVKAKLPDVSYEEYVKQANDIHRESYLFRLIHGFNKGISSGVGSGTLAHRIAVMSMYPKIRDYSNIMNWYITATEYEEKYVGRGTDAGDFILIQGMASYIKLKGIANVSDETWEKWKQFILNLRWHYPDIEMSENHKMIFYEIAVLAGECWPDEIMYDGKTGKETLEEQKAYLYDWFNYRMNRGMGEYDSPNYYNVNLFGAEQFYSCVKDEKLKSVAYDYITLIYADALTDSHEDNLTGSALRDYHNLEGIKKLKPMGFMFNTSTYMIDENYHMNVQEGHYAMDDYTPPEALYELALQDDRVVENKERHYMYLLKDDPEITQSIRKYTYRTPDYAVGSRVYSEVNTPEKVQTSTWQQPTTVLDGAQEIQWSICPGGGGDGIITHNHPGSTGHHSEFYGDNGCMCGMYFQSKGASIGMNKIAKSGQAQKTHFYIPTAKLQKVIEKDGWIFAEHFDTYIAIKPMMNGKTKGVLYEWGDNRKYNGMLRSECEVISNSADTAFVSEVSSKSEFGGSFDKFVLDILANEKNITYSTDKDNYILEYKSLNGDVIKIDYNNNQRFLNGESVEFTDWKMFDSQYVQSDWLSGEIEIKGTDSVYKINSVKGDMSLAAAQKLLLNLNDAISKVEYAAKSGRVVNALSNAEAVVENTRKKLAGLDENYLKGIVENKCKKLEALIVKHNK